MKSYFNRLFGSKQQEELPELKPISEAPKGKRNFNLKDHEAEVVMTWQGKPIEKKKLIVKASNNNHAAHLIQQELNWKLVSVSPVKEPRKIKIFNKK